MSGLAAVAAMVMPCANAQTSSVNLYGVMDTGLEFVTHAGPGGSGSQFRESAGNTVGSRWGLRGKEDLGGGNSAVFAIEGGILSDTGMAGQGGRLFGRQSLVGLETPYGAVTFGHQIHTLYGLVFLVDPVRYASYGVLAHDAYLAGRVDNSVKYQNNFGPLSIVGTYSFGFDGTIANGGEVPGNFRVGQQIGAGASYTVENLAVIAAYDQRRGTSIATQGSIERRYVTGVAWSRGAFTAMLGYRLLQGSLAGPSVRTNLYWAGASYQFTPAFSLSGGVYRSDQRHSGDDATSFTLVARYALSKRSDLYLNATFMNNEGASRLGAAIATTVAPGVNQTGVVAGIKHVF